MIVALLYTQGTEKDTAYQKNYYVGEFCDDKRHGKGLLFDLKDKSFTATVRYKHEGSKKSQLGVSRGGGPGLATAGCCCCERPSRLWPV